MNKLIDKKRPKKMYLVFILSFLGHTLAPRFPHTSKQNSILQRISIKRYFHGFWKDCLKRYLARKRALKDDFYLFNLFMIDLITKHSTYIHIHIYIGRFWRVKMSSSKFYFLIVSLYIIYMKIYWITKCTTTILSPFPLSP
jgi:hypothetical protein